MSKRHQHLIVTEPYEPLKELQRYGVVVPVPIALDASVRGISVENLNQLLVDTMTLRDLYKKHHWQVSGPTFYQLHLLFDKHFNEQAQAGRRHRGTDPNAWRREHRHGSRRGGVDGDAP